MSLIAQRHKYMIYCLINKQFYSLHLLLMLFDSIRDKQNYPFKVLESVRDFVSPFDEKGSQIGSLFLSEKAVFLFCSHLLEGFTKDVVAGVAGNGTLVLAPQEWPIVKILKVVGLAEQQAGSHVTRYE